MWVTGRAVVSIMRDQLGGDGCPPSILGALFLVLSWLPYESTSLYGDFL